MATDCRARFYRASDVYSSSVLYFIYISLALCEDKDFACLLANGNFRAHSVGCDVY